MAGLCKTQFVEQCRKMKFVQPKPVEERFLQSFLNRQLDRQERESTSRLAEVEAALTSSQPSTALRNRVSGTDLNKGLSTGWLDIMERDNASELHRVEEGTRQPSAVCQTMSKKSEKPHIMTIDLNKSFSNACFHRSQKGNTTEIGGVEEGLITGQPSAGSQNRSNISGKHRIMAIDLNQPMEDVVYEANFYQVPELGGDREICEAPGIYIGVQLHETQQYEVPGRDVGPENLERNIYEEPELGLDLDASHVPGLAAQANLSEDPQFDDGGESHDENLHEVTESHVGVQLHERNIFEGPEHIVELEADPEDSVQISKLLDDLAEKYPPTKGEKDMDSMFAEGEYPTLAEILSAQAPKEGMTFESEKVAYHFFAVYARRMGFAIKRDRSYKCKKTGELTKLLLVCNKHRKNLADNPMKQRRSNFVVKTNCMVRVQLKKETQGWVASTVNLEHNHTLLPSEWLVRFMRCHKHISTSDRKFISVLQNSRVPPRKVMTIFRSLRGSFRALDFDEADISNIAAAEKKRHENRDIQDLLEMFRTEQGRAPGFFYTLQLDETDGTTVRSVFWTDLMGRKNYELYGEYLSFDTTFSTNRYNMPFAPLIGVNNHGNTVLFGCALLQNQKAETFEWLFKVFVDAMGGKRPINIITDQDKAIRKAIVLVFPDATHRFCNWHIFDNIKKHLKSYLAARGQMGAKLHYLIRNAFTADEFEQGWQAIIGEYKAEKNEYLIQLYAIRQQWAPAYFKDKLYPFSSTTGRSESTNKLFKDYTLRKDTITNFFQQYLIIQEKSLSKLDRKRFISEGTTGSTWSASILEKEAMNVFTRPIVSRLQKEMRSSTAYIVEEEIGGTYFRLMRVNEYDAEYDKPMYEVTVSEDAQNYKCSCAKLQRDGLHCCHVFNVAARKGLTKLPESFIHPRWTIEMDRKLDEMTRAEGIVQQTENDTSVRYVVLMSKMSKHCAEMCTDELSSQMFDEGVERLVKTIKKKRTSITNNDNAAPTSGNGIAENSGSTPVVQYNDNAAHTAGNGIAENSGSAPVVQYNDPPQANTASVALGKRLKPMHEIIAMQGKKQKQPRRCTVCRSESHFKDKCPKKDSIP